MGYGVRDCTLALGGQGHQGNGCRGIGGGRGTAEGACETSEIGEVAVDGTLIAGCARARLKELLSEG